jgi:hypothetical protein
MGEVYAQQHGIKKKTPIQMIEVSSLFAVTHPGPAQGGKAGDGCPSGLKSNKMHPAYQDEQLLLISIF